MAELMRDKKPNIFQRAVIRMLGPEFIRMMSNGTVAWSSFMSGSAGDVLTDPYGQQAVVYSCIKLLLDELPQSPFTIYTASRQKSRDEGGYRSFIDWRKTQQKRMMRGERYQRINDSGYEEVTGHELNQLFNRPNPLQSANQFWAAVTGFYSYQGECDIVCTERNNVTELPEWMIPTSPKEFEPKPDRSMVPEYWKYTDSMTSKTGSLMPWNLIRPRTWNPSDMRRGQSPLEAALSGLTLDWNARIYNKSFFENDGTPGVAYIAERSMKKPQRDDWLEGFENRHQGASKAFRAALLHGIKDIKVLGFSPKDAQFPELMGMTKTELAMIWRIPLLLLSEHEGLPNAKAETELKRLWTDTIFPIQRNFEDAFSAELFQSYEGGRYWGAFDNTSIGALQVGFETRLDQAKIFYDMHYTPNQINDRLDLGMENVPWGDVPIVDGNKVSINDVLSGKTLTKQDAVTPRMSTRADASKQSIFNRFDKVRAEYIEKFLKKYRRFLFEYRKELLANVDKMLRTDEALANIIMANEEHWNNVLNTSVEGIYMDSMEASYHIAASQLGQASPFLTATSPETMASAMSRQQMLRGVNHNMREALREQIMEGLGQHETVGQIRERIKDVMNFNSSHATTVARTEIGSAMSEARFNEFKADGVEYNLWSVADMTARKSHLQAAGNEPVKLGDIFDPTDCRYPLDWMGPPGEVINCRCVLVPSSKTG